MIFEVGTGVVVVVVAAAGLGVVAPGAPLNPAVVGAWLAAAGDGGPALRSSRYMGSSLAASTLTTVEPNVSACVRTTIIVTNEIQDFKAIHCPRRWRTK